MSDKSTDNNIAVVSMAEYFRASLSEAAQKHKLSIAEHTHCYLVNLLISFSRTEALFEVSATGQHTKPTLTLLLSQSLAAVTTREKERGMQRLGDLALFTVGFFSHSFSRKLVDVDYYAAMGGNAYAMLADQARSPGLNVIRPVFAELARKFIPIMDALNELADQSHSASSDDVMRYYEIWLKTGSRRSYNKLLESGLNPIVGNTRQLSC